MKCVSFAIFLVVAIFGANSQLYGAPAVGGVVENAVNAAESGAAATHDAQGAYAEADTAGVLDVNHAEHHDGVHDASGYGFGGLAGHGGFAGHGLYGPGFAGHGLLGAGYAGLGLHGAGFAGHGLHGAGFAGHGLYGAGFAGHGLHGFAGHGLYGAGFAGHGLGLGGLHGALGHGALAHY
uniref:Histidine rich beak protein 1 n=1 Tax=Dosidicus gigas TaxID=346249 RepID=A0A0G2UMW8_DOSGI|nr:histidine rich beak protein 1 [Dosidicus gigas]